MRRYGPSEGLNVGDYCLVSKPREDGVSRRFQLPHFEQVFQVYDKYGEGASAKAYVLSDLKGNTENLGFTQPVSYDRLTPIDMLPLVHPHEEGSTRIAVDVGGDTRAGVVVNQTLDGNVYIKFDDNPDVEELLDLCTARYRWQPV